MDLGFSELVRQVSIQCNDRGELMNRMWNSSHELFQTLLIEMTGITSNLHHKLMEANHKINQVSILNVTSYILHYHSVNKYV